MQLLSSASWGVRRGPLSDGHSQELLNRTPSVRSYDSCQTPCKTDCKESTKNSKSAHHTLFLVQFLQQLSFAGTIVDSYQIGKFFEVSPAFSGLLVGLFMTGGAVGTSFMTLILQARPTAWKSFRSIVLGCQLMDTAGVFLYTLLMILAADGQQTGHGWIYCLAMVRFAWGLGSGVTGQLAAVTITKVTPPHEIPEEMQSLQFWQSLGLGMGPFLAGLAALTLPLSLQDATQYKLCAAPAALLSLQVVSLLLLFSGFAGLCPSSLEEWQEAEGNGNSAGPVASTAPPQLHSGRVQMLFLGSCFLLCSLRGYAVAGAEVGTTMLLEESYEWNRHSIGFLVSGAFLASIPLRSAYLRNKSVFSTASWIRILALIAMAGTLLLFSRVAEVMPHGVALVLADAIMFPALYLGEGLTRGLMLQFAKDSTVLSANQASFLAIVLNNCARTVAPWLSRKHISTGAPSQGQDLFATGQLLCCGLFLVIFEFGIQQVSEAGGAAPAPVIVIGLPSLNEAHNIESVTKAVDAGCHQHFPKHRCILVNADCQSSDGTPDIFARTPTHCQKVLLRTALPAQGKGAALRLVFEYMLQVDDCTHGLTLDTDVTSITPDWIKSFSLALADHDFVAPRYARHRLDGFITNLLIYPSLCAVFGRDVRQGIGGDFGFSRRAAEAFLAEEWSPSIEKYGIDIFMTSTVLKKGGRFSIGEVELPAKVHSPSLPKLKRMVLEVLEVLLQQLKGERFSLEKLQALPRIVLPPQLQEQKIPELQAWEGVDPAVLLNLAEQCFQEDEACIMATLATLEHARRDETDSFSAALAERTVDSTTWAQLLHSALTTEAGLGSLETLRCFFFLRAASHCKDVQALSNFEAENLVKSQRDQLARLARRGICHP
ncbi:ggs [Symbiodinium sp. CCMP2592]|nr:ggs [Symbiodinium sp. CCMP2592]